MNYQKLYDSVIERARCRGLVKKTVSFYTEGHHIVPKSLGGTDKKENRVLLSAREHFLCHYVLTKLYPKGSTPYYKMIKAFLIMGWAQGRQERYVNSRLYESLKVEFSKAYSVQSSGTGNSQYGRTRSPESKEKVRKKLLEHYGNNPNAGKEYALKRLAIDKKRKLSGATLKKRNCMPLSADHKDAIRLAASKKWDDPEYRKRHKEGMDRHRGSSHPLTAETRAKLSKNLKKQWEDPEFRARMQLRKSGRKKSPNPCGSIIS